MSNVEWVALADVAEINPRVAGELASHPSQSVSFVPMSAVSQETASVVAAEEREAGECLKGYTPFVRGDVLVAKITPCFENGKIVLADIPHRFGFGSPEFHVVRADAKRVDSRFMLHVLRHPEFRLKGQSRMTGSAGQRRVPEHFLSTFAIPLPPLFLQRRIAGILDKADALRAKRRAALAQLDSLTQSIFLDMFGDPATNPKGWPVQVIRDLLDSASYGTSEKAGPTGEFPVLRMNNISPTGEMDYTDLKFMDLEPKNYSRYLVQYGDVLFNRTNSVDLVGKTGIFRESKPMAYAGYLIRLRVNGDNSPEYLAAFLNSNYSKAMLRGMCKSIIGMANINATEIQAMKISKPPINFQREFAAQVTAVEALKSIHRASGKTRTVIALSDLLKWDALEWDDDGNVPDRVEAEAVNKWLFNKDTVDKVLEQPRQDSARLRDRVVKLAEVLAENEAIPAVRKQMELILEVQTNEWWQDVTVPMLESMRLRLRNLVHLIEKQARKVVYTDIEDEIGTGQEVNLPGWAVGMNEQKFRDKARQFLRQHQDHAAIRKLRENRQLNASDLVELERMLVENGVGEPQLIRQAAEDADGLGLFVRSLVGIDREAAKAALSGFIAGKTLTANQLEFINLIVDHLTEHGSMEPGRLYASPFTDLSPQGPDGIFLSSDVDMLMNVLKAVRETAIAA